MNNHFRKTMYMAASALLLVEVSASDWPQWRGPNRDGLVQKVDWVSLTEGWPEEGLRKIWDSEPVPGDDNNNGGYGSVVVAGGRAYVYVNWQGTVSLSPFCILPSDSLKRLGWTGGDTLPGEIEAKVEVARLSVERAKVEKEAVESWIDDWMGENLTVDEQAWESWGTQVRHRLRSGPSARSPAVIKSLIPLKNHLFDSREDLKRGLRQAGVPEEFWPGVLASVSTEFESQDVILCFDAASGKTLWQTEYPSARFDKAGTSCTPTIVNGRCYLIGGGGFVYCLDAETGRECWKTRISGELGAEVSSSIVIVGDSAIGMCVPLTAFDLQTGRVIWRQPLLQAPHNSPVVWMVEGKHYLLCNDDLAGKVACVDPVDGRVLWTVDGGGKSTVVISGEVMVVFSADNHPHLTAYRLSLANPQRMWGHEHFRGRGESPLIYDGYVYIFGMEGRAACVNLDTGVVAWEEGIDTGGVSSPIALDGQILVPYAWGKKLMAIRATPSRYEVLAQEVLSMSWVASPAFSDGRLFLRMKHAVACYELPAN